MWDFKLHYERLRVFFEKDLWLTDLGNLPLKDKLWFYPLKLIVMVVKGLLRKDMYKTASSLTYYSMLSIVPVVALAFGIAKGFGLQKFVEKQVYVVLEGRPEVADMVLKFSERMINTTSGGIIAGAGLVFLLSTIIILLNRIETSLNEIWMVEKSRPLIRKLTENITIIFLAPIVVILAAGANVAITREVDSLINEYYIFSLMGPGIHIFLRLVPLFMVGVLFSVIYIIFPNTNVRILPGLMAGFIAGFLYLLVQNLYVGFQVGVSSYNAIYGSFASLPLFLVWLNLSWLTVLVGAELSHALHFFDSTRPKQEPLQLSSAMRKTLALTLLYHIVKAFRKGEKAPTIENLSEVYGMPNELVHDLLRFLQRASLIDYSIALDEEAKPDPSRDKGLRPALDPEVMTVKEVYLRLEYCGKDDARVQMDKEETYERMRRLTQRMTELLRKEADELPLYTLSNQEKEAQAIQI